MMSRHIRLVILFRLVDMMPENLFLPNERIVVCMEKFVEISPENSFEDKSMNWRSILELKSGKLLPKNLFLDKSNIVRVARLEMDSGIFPEKLLSFSIRDIR